jgi:hypothetical protein
MNFWKKFEIFRKSRNLFLEFSSEKWEEKDFHARGKTHFSQSEKKWSRSRGFSWAKPPRRRRTRTSRTVPGKSCGRQNHKNLRANLREPERENSRGREFPHAKEENSVRKDFVRENFPWTNGFLAHKRASDATKSHREGFILVLSKIFWEMKWSSYTNATQKVENKTKRMNPRKLLHPLLAFLDF